MTLLFGYIRGLTITTTSSCRTPSFLLLRYFGVGLHSLPKQNQKKYDVAYQSITTIAKYCVGADLRRYSTNVNNESVGSAIKPRNPFTILPNRWHCSNKYYSSSGSSNNSNNANEQSPPHSSISSLQQPFVPMTPQEEENEKLRVSQLSPSEKDMEFRQLNRQIAVLEKKRGINTGELYTWSGKYKALARDYGMPLLVWYWAIWISTGIVCYTTITLFDVDVMYLLQQIDVRTGYAISEQVNPEYGKIGMALVINEIIEPLRLPIVIVTVKPVIDRLFPPKY